MAGRQPAGFMGVVDGSPCLLGVDVHAKIRARSRTSRQPPPGGLGWPRAGRRTEDALHDAGAELSIIAPAIV